jgi:hypothetical protein
LADTDDVADLQQRPVDAPAVDERAVRRADVDDLGSTGADRTMTDRRRWRSIPTI